MPPSLATFPVVHHPMRSMHSWPVQHDATNLRSDVVAATNSSTCIVSSLDQNFATDSRPVTVRVVLQDTKSGVDAILQRASFYNDKTTINVHVDPTENVPGRKLHILRTQATVHVDTMKESSVYSTHLIDVYTSRFYGEAAVTATLVIPSGGKPCAAGALDVEVVLAWC